MTPNVGQQRLRNVRVCEFLGFVSETCKHTAGTPTHQFETFKGEHGLFNHVIFRLSFRKLFFLLSVGNTIRFFFRAMSYRRSSGQSRPQM